ncbi:MAG: multicopper oxidase domain-containing protein [Alphaproteobacteria bacterium]|nr:multicopper oxidase domain-containing protein [Alphaproteobacteria bacterium]
MLKFFGIVGLVGAVLFVYLVTYGERQLPPEVSLLEGFREQGFVPENRNLAFDESAEEANVFEVPEQDGVVLAAALANDPMAGMDMSGSSTGGDAMEGMDMSGSSTGGDAMEGMDMSGSDSSGAMNMDGMEMGEGGLGFAEEGKFDREIELSMDEWKFSDMQIDVKMGERIKFTVKNGGQIPHEFMFMTGPLMAAATYRGTRADWNLLEHEALFEQSLVLPGGEFSFVVQVQEAGSWMFMCMLPYHMQLGMMGQMATEGMAMDMDM